MYIKESAQDYVEAVLIIEKQKGFVRSVDIANYLRVTKPSVSYAIKNLQNEGYLIMDEDKDKEITLTPKGRELAEIMYERHMFFTNWLERLGVNSTIAAADACRIEHAISKESFEAIRKAVSDCECDDN